MEYYNFTSLVISLVALVVATTSTLISYLIFRASEDPNVVVYATEDEKVPWIILLVIENTGNGVARDVTFSSSKPIPRGMGQGANKPTKNFDTGPLATGIPSLGPGSKRVITWGHYNGIHAAIGDDTIDITAQYRGKPAMSFGWKSYASTSRIEIRSFEGTDASDRGWDKKTAEHIGSIKETLEKLAGPHPQALRVEVVDRSELDQ